MEKVVYKKVFEEEVSDWWYEGLRKIVFYYLYKYSKIGGKLLDVGCGSGYLLTLLKNDWEVWGIDNDMMAVNEAKKKGLKRIKHASVEKIPFRKNYFDVVLLLDVIEHVSDDVLALQEIYRVLKPGGVVVINTPAYKILWSSHDVSAKHKRRYTKKELATKLSSVGFNKIKTTYINTILFPIAVIHRLLSKYNIVRSKTDVGVVPRFFQPFFYLLFSMEAYIVRYFNFPFGLSVSAVVKK